MLVFWTFFTKDIHTKEVLLSCVNKPQVICTIEYIITNTSTYDKMFLIEVSLYLLKVFLYRLLGNSSRSFDAPCCNWDFAFSLIVLLG